MNNAVRKAQDDVKKLEREAIRHAEAELKKELDKEHNAKLEAGVRDAENRKLNKDIEEAVAKTTQELTIKYKKELEDAIASTEARMKKLRMNLKDDTNKNNIERADVSMSKFS